MHQVAWKKPFARELEEKIQIGIDHDFIGHHNRRSGYYASNEQGMLRNLKNNNPINLCYHQSLKKRGDLRNFLVSLRVTLL